MSEDELAARLRAAGCVWAEDEARLLLEACRDADALDTAVRRRVHGEPLEHVLGWADVLGLRVTVTPGVFVPRRRSWHLARLTRDTVADGEVVVDLCCGAGAIGMVVLTAVPDVVLHAADLDPAAVACARENLGPLGGTVHEGDLFDALPASLRGRVDVVACNAPYVPSAQLALLPAEARLHEPTLALDGGADGVAVQRRVALGAAAWLAPGGRLLVETGADQVARTSAAMVDAGLAVEVAHDDDLDATVVVGRQDLRS